MRTAILTPSYVGDFDRCKLMCETVDRFFTGDWHHYILVERNDIALFSQLAGPRRTILGEDALFPAWLRSYPDPLARGRRRIWLSPFSRPLRGWHAQQLRLLAMARHVDADAFLTIDSDSLVVRPYDPASLWTDGDLRFYRVDNAATTAASGHLAWIAHAGNLLGLPRRPDPAHDYVSTFLPWRVDTTRALLDHIEKTTGKSWLRAVTSSRDISECMIYGRYVDEVLDGAGHRRTDKSLAHVLWTREAFPETAEGLADFTRGIAGHHVGICIQSFVDHPIEDVRRLAATFYEDDGAQGRAAVS
ncbi:DUF6492 family protein [Pseudohoeflea coraliihabitans]|uniref:Uncharacterized protein n=1 Tax=Pseudohoeflea coraliihabitans TaxID=2860393 RepID=A0ABS6WPV5_9HYPH|nr:DUF6492 family protein [Pseudohoeflea sp. DP4N28-3]MBW3097999.1 hypothetical protein [Pseudohoeflea sp. DP4N28-3]